MVWAPGEHDAWLRTPIANPSGGGVTIGPITPSATRDATWEKRIANIRAGVADALVQRESYWQAAMLAKGPEELVRPALRDWRPSDWHQSGLGTRNAWSPDHWLKPSSRDSSSTPCPPRSRRPIGARHAAASVLPFLDGDGAGRWPTGWSGSSPARRTRAPGSGGTGPAPLPYLVPDALGKAGPARRPPRRALRLHRRHGTAPRRSSGRAGLRRRGGRGGRDAAGRGPAGAAAGPRKIPARLGGCRARLPQLLLRDRAGALPGRGGRAPAHDAGDVEPGEPYAGSRSSASCATRRPSPSSAGRCSRWRELSARRPRTAGRSRARRDRRRRDRHAGSPRSSVPGPARAATPRR